MRIQAAAVGTCPFLSEPSENPVAPQCAMLRASIRSSEHRQHRCTAEVVEEAAGFALSHPPAPISKRDVPKTNRLMVAAGGAQARTRGVQGASMMDHDGLCGCRSGRCFIFPGLHAALNMAFNAQPLMVAPAGIVKCFEAACSGKSFKEGVAVEMEEFTKLVPWPHGRTGLEDEATKEMFS